MDQLPSAPFSAFDWPRILWGNTGDWLFLLEVCMRTAVMFGWLVLMMRLIGKRGVGQISMVELVFVMALGSAAGDPMLYPDVPLIPAMLCITILVLLHRLMTWLLVKNEGVETLLEGVPHELVRDGQINLDQLDKARLSKEDLFEFLRVANVRQLGQVERAYQEQNGQISVIRHEDCHASPAGLPIVPPWDLKCPPAAQPDQACEQNPVSCKQCGHCVRVKVATCPACQGNDWTFATCDPLTDARFESASQAPASSASAPS